jgi:hypothetical protein
VAAVACVAVVAAVALGTSFANNTRGDPGLPSLVGDARHASGRDGRPVAIAFPSRDWPLAVGFLLAAERSRLPACFSDPTWAFMVTADNICHRPSRGHGDWPVTITAATPRASRSAIWSGGGYAVVPVRPSRAA